MKPKGIDWDRQPLGAVSDVDLAHRLGVHASLVSGARRRRGIPPYDPNARLRYFLQTHEGKFSDAQVAKRFGVNRSVVLNVRLRAGLRPKHGHEHAPDALRESILQALRASEDVLHAAEVYRIVRDDFGTVSLRQVQRQLQRLVRVNKVRREGENTHTVYSLRRR